MHESILFAVYMHRFQAYRLRSWADSTLRMKRAGLVRLTREKIMADCEIANKTPLSNSNTDGLLMYKPTIQHF